ncbi:MAG TPA: choice-of-anchor tandem repeat GloVer-containing protein [Terriglobales bacterium]|nr:choice-of-anchor tandem repeat GloVer-containing protein [Terriglobales bacterium]
MTNRVYVMTFLIVLVLAALAQAQTFTVLHNFSGGSDGWGPYAGLIQDPAGDLYGTTSLGGDPNCTPGYGYGCGVVFKLDTVGTETVLHTFWGSDGTNPVAPVLRDKAGNIYGTTSYGGSSGYGTVFKIDTAGIETVLYSFTGGPDGCYPFQGVVVGNPVPCSSPPRSAAHPAMGRSSRLKAEETLPVSTASPGVRQMARTRGMGISRWTRLETSTA